MSHALLLRLFLSPSFFSVHVALQYLRLYADNIGISHYLAHRLREFSIAELVDVWGFICHLLITKPSRSIALETFVLETAERSTHVSMLTLFYCQATLHDLANMPRDTASFAVCQRVSNRCHDIVFGDPPAPITHTPYMSPAFLGRPSTRFWRKRVRPHLGPALVGMTCIVGTQAIPSLSRVVGKWAVDQGRIDSATRSASILNEEEEEMLSPLASPAPPIADATIMRSPEEESDEEPTTATSVEEHTEISRHVALRRSLDQTLASHAAQTSPELVLYGPKPRSVRTMDPFGQLDHFTPSSSSPSVSLIRATPSRSATTPMQVLSRYDPTYQQQLLRCHYSRSEVNFLQGLESISNRLLIVPKPARVSALRAELTALNNSLPAEVCMPMWCSATDDAKSNGHRRIVRIPPGESVVLNSAERAPYLLIIEVLDDDLDFDPSKRHNRDLLTKIVLEGDGIGDKPGPGSGSLGRTPSFRRGVRRPLDIVSPSVTATHEDSPPTDATIEPQHPVIGVVIPPSPLTPAQDIEEEMDLVEQIYGEDHSTNDAVSESIVLPPKPKNKTLESRAWAASAPSSPYVSAEPTARDSSEMSPIETHRFSSISQEMTMDDYSERMRTAASMLAQLNANLAREPTAPGTGPETPTTQTSRASSALRWLPGKGWILGAISRPSSDSPNVNAVPNTATRMKLQPSEVAAITEKIMNEMMALEEERMQRMQESVQSHNGLLASETSGGKTAEDESIVRRELNKVDPSAVVFRESWTTKKSRIRSGSPYGHLANWDCVSVIVKTGGDLRQEQLAVQLVQLFERIWKQENVGCWYVTDHQCPFHSRLTCASFRILITGNNSGLVETITDSVSIHSIKKAEYARRLSEGNFRQVTLYDHFLSTYGSPTSSKFIRAQRNFAKSLAGYSIITYLLQIKDRHNGNILLDREGHLVHIDFGFMLSNSPGNIGFEAAPFKLPTEYIEILGGLEGEQFLEFKKLFRDGFAAARKHCDSLITLVELMQKDSTLPCFAAYGEQTANMMRERFQPQLTHSAVEEFTEKLIMTSLASAWTRLYDSFQYYSQGVL